MLAIGIIGFVFFTFVGVMFLLKAELVLLDVLCFIPVWFLPLEILYEGLYSRIEISNAGIVYHQPRFALSCKWEDLINIFDYQYGITLLFSNANILHGKWIATLLKPLGPWERAVPFGCYISPQNAKKLQDIILVKAINLDTDAKTYLEYTLGNI